MQAVALGAGFEPATAPEQRHGRGTARSNDALFLGSGMANVSTSERALCSFFTCSSQTAFFWTASSLLERLAILP